MSEMSEENVIDQPPPLNVTGGGGSDTRGSQKPPKLFKSNGRVIVYNERLKRGIAQVEGGTPHDGYTFSYFSLDIFFGSDAPPEKGTLVKCDAWLFNERAKIPYLAAVVWTEGSHLDEGARDKILAKPSDFDFDFYKDCCEELHQLLPGPSQERKPDKFHNDNGSRREHSEGGDYGGRSGRVKEERSPTRVKSESKYDDRSHKRHKKDRRRSRSRSRDSRRSRSRESKRSKDKKRRSRSRDRKHRDDRKRSRERSSRERRFREESPDRSYDDDDDYGERMPMAVRGMPGLRRMFRGRVAIRGRFIRGFPPGGRGNPMGLPKPLAKPKLAIGRNVFPASDEEEEGGDGAGGRGRPPRGRWMRLPRGGGRVGSKMFGGPGGGGGFEGGGEERPGLGFSGKPHIRENSRWKRWQQLCRKQGGDEEEGGGEREMVGGGASDTSPVSEYEGNEMRKRPRTTSSSRRDRSPDDSISDSVNGMRVIILTYENEEVGLLSGPKDTKVLFHIDQVWISHPSAGFCPFKEIYPTVELTKHFYPGREVRCLKRDIPKTRDVNCQARAVWLIGLPPDEQLFNTKQLENELSFHLEQYQLGKYGRLDMLVPVSQQKSLDAVVHEYISHEMGVAKLIGGDDGVILFHLDQVWTFDRGTWLMYKEVMKTPLNYEYMAVGSRVSVSVRMLPHSANSQLRYQAMVIWEKDVCRYRESMALETNSLSSFSQRCVQEGDCPPNYILKYSPPDAHHQLVKTLDMHFDNFKRICKFDLKCINPVPVVLNLLPEDWEAKVYKAVDDEHGLIMISHSSGSNLGPDSKMKILKLFAIFHIEDVYTVQGEKFRRSPSEFMVQLKDQPVDLTARSIVGEGVRQGVIIAASQLSLSLMNPNMAGPVLQAITVFLKPTLRSNPNTNLAPKPTYLRSFPDSFHYSKPATAFFFNCLLQTKLDLKALNFFESTTKARLQKEIINGLAMSYFNQTKKNVLSDKQEQLKMLKDMETLDVNKSFRLIYGSFMPLPTPPIRPHYPPTLQSVVCSVRVLYQEGYMAKDGIVMCEIPTETGHHIAAYAYFNISNYKFSLQKEIRHKDFAETIPLHCNPSLRAHIVLISEMNPVPYVATAVWNSRLWSRAPDVISKLDDLYIQKYERITGLITNRSTPNPAMLAASSVGPVGHGRPPISHYPPVAPSAVVYPPPPVAPLPSFPTAVPSGPPPPRALWSKLDLLREKVGKVTSVIDDNYGLAVVRFACPTNRRDRYRAIVLFDTCDLWLGEHTATELNMPLGQCLKEGDYIKVKALKVPESENSKNIRYLATGVVTGRSKAQARNILLPDQETIEHIDRIHPDKLNNFYQVVSVVCANIPGDAEEEANGVSTDDEEISTPAVPVFPATVGSSHQAGSGFGHFGHSAEDPLSAVHQQLGKSSHISIDAFETERENKKLAKMTECQNLRRKMGYDKAAREEELAKLKLPNQLMWKCPECQVSCAKPGMEKHILLKAHWNRVAENYCRMLDAMRAPKRY